MSRPREDWWPAVRAAIRAYPGRKRRLAELRRTPVTAHYGPPSRGGGAGDPTTAAALRTLPDRQQQELEAVEAALDQTARLPDGARRVMVIDIYHFRRTHLLTGAGLAAGYGEAQARRIHGQFVRLVAERLGYLG